MCRVLILDDELRYAESLKLLVDGFEENHFITEIATNPDTAAEYARAAVEDGQPYTVFIVDQRLGPGMDGIEVLKQLRYISRDSYAVMLTGNTDTEVGRRAYEAGAYRYLTKPADEKEMLFVLNSALQARRVEVESRWRKVFSEMMETALQRERFDDVARVVVGHCVRLGFERAHLFWAPKQGNQTHQDFLVGIACEGPGCIPSFPDTRFNLYEKNLLKQALNSRNMTFVHENEAGDELRAEIESIGCPYPRGGLWLLPLWSGEELAGTLLLDFGQTRKYLTPEHHTLLDFFARQVSVALEHTRLYNEQKRTGEEMELLQRASVEMLRIGNQSKEHFWHTVLTIATANFGLKFNRAWLFLREDNCSAFRGWAAVGTNDGYEAYRDWESAREYTLDSFLVDVFAKRIRLTPLNDLIQGLEIPLEELHAEVRDALRDGQTAILPEMDVLNRLPYSFTKVFSPMETAVLPVQVGSVLQGFVLVDNKHNRKPLNRIALDNLQTLLANAGVVWETLRQRARSEDLLEANYRILGGAGYTSLSETLRIICKTARTFSQADWVSIYPFPKNIGSPSYKFEFENVGYDGELKSHADMTREQPDVGGVSMYILQNGSLIINCLDEENPPVGGIPLSQHQFIQREGVKALAGIAIYESDSREPLGIFYLDYFEPHNFSEVEIRHARSFASLAAVAISNARRLDERHQRALLKTAQRISETVGAELDIEEVMTKILTELKIIFHDTSLCVLLYDENENALKFAPHTLRFYEITNPEFQDLRSFPLYSERKASIACKVARTTQQIHKTKLLPVRNVKDDPDYLPLNPKTIAEVCVSLVDRQGNLLGVLALEWEKQVFLDVDLDFIRIAAHQLEQAIERTRQTDDLAFKSTVATMTAWASDIAHDINSEVGKIRGNAYLLKQISDDPKAKRFADEIDQSAKKLSSVGPWSEQSKREIPLDKSLQGMIESIARQRNVQLELNLRTPNLQIRVNPNEFQHVLRHLVRNAARAMQDMAEKKISVSTRYLPAARVEIVFQDYGPGIEEKIRASIFQRRITTKPSSGGYGLLIVRQLVEDIGGKITLLSAEPGKGAAFSIKLPITMKQPIPPRNTGALRHVE